MPRTSILLVWGMAILSLARAGHGYVLSGTITGGGSPLAEATVELYDAARTSVLQTTQTQVNGYYAFVLEDGTYDLVVTPPAATNYRSFIVNDLVISGSDLVDNMALVSGASILKGTVRGPDRTPASWIRVIVKDVISGAVVAEAITDDTGQYSFNLAPGNYSVDVERQGTEPQPSSVLTPPSFYIRPFLANVELTGSLEQDLILPLLKLTGHIVDPQDQPVPDVEIQALSTWELNGATYQMFFGRQVTYADANGDFELGWFASPAVRLTLTPPDGANVVSTYFDLGLTTDTERNFVLNEGVRLQGTVRLPDGTAVRNIKVSAHQWETAADEDLSDDAGAYELLVAPGDYWLNVSYDPPTGPANVPLPGFGINRIQENVQLTTDTLIDLTLPIYLLHGKVLSESGQPIPNVRFDRTPNDTWRAGNAGEWFLQLSQNSFTSDDNGDYQLRLLRHNGYNLVLTPPMDSAYAPTIFGAIDVTADTQRDFVLQKAVNLRATLHGPLGIPLRNAFVYFSQKLPTDYLYFKSATTDASGAISCLMSPGVYRVRLDFQNNPFLLSGPDNPLPGQFESLNLLGDLELTSDTTVTWQMPLSILQGRTTDRNGVPVKGVEIKIPYDWYGDQAICNDYGHTVSDAYGFYITSLIRTALNGSIAPPAESGFAQTPLRDLDMTTDTLLNIILDFMDTVPPLIIAGPYVRQITHESALVEWETNEPATSGVEFGIAPALDRSLDSSPTLVLHSVALTSLTADTTYTLRVNSVDAGGNGPVVSDLIAFRTMPQPDLKPPVITAGPLIQSITAHTAEVEWTTDEPADTVLFYGLSQSLDLVTSISEFVTEHRVRLENLSADSQYFLKISARDVAGNGPTESQVFPFQTLAEPDTTAPVIINGPAVIQISATEATVIWTTDEPASSGVSYNDGTHHGVITDEMAVLDHRVRLTGLTPSTAYEYTVSSTDAFGNGPTLSPTLGFTTLATVDNNPPVITLGPLVQSITKQSALIVWDTDEPADAVVRYGLTAELGQEETQAQLTTHHALPLTNLLADSLYYFQVLSKDGAGNGPTSSTLLTFRTDAEDGQKNRLIDGPKVVASSDKDALIHWETTEPCDSIVEYGEAGEPLKRRSDGAKVNDHTLRLTNLEPNREYIFRISSTDALLSSSLAASGIRLAATTQTFRTGASPDLTPPQISQGPEIAYVSNDLALVHWKTNEPADATVEYAKAGGPTLRVASIVQRTDHWLTLTNLQPGTPYQYRVLSSDLGRNGPTASPLLNLQTGSSADVTPPGFSGEPSCTIGNLGQSRIQWTSDEVTYGYIEYGLDPEHLDGRQDFWDMGLIHDLTLPDLPPNQTCYYRIHVVDPAGNQATGALLSFARVSHVDASWVLYE